MTTSLEYTNMRKRSSGLQTSLALIGSAVAETIDRPEEFRELADKICRLVKRELELCKAADDLLASSCDATRELIRERADVTVNATLVRDRNVVNLAAHRKIPRVVPITSGREPA